MQAPRSLCETSELSYMPIVLSRFPISVLALAFAAQSIVMNSAAAGPVEKKPNPLGVWLTQAGDAKVRVSPCSPNICGKVMWLREPIDKATGKPQRDDKNPDPSLRTRSVIGLQLFVNMHSSTVSAWSGRIYNADDGQTYASTVTPLDNGRLEIKGCVGAICGSEIWTRSSL